MLVEADNLKGKDLTSKSDPYTMLSVGGERFRSDTVKNSHNPVWKDQVFLVRPVRSVKLSLAVLLFVMNLVPPLVLYSCRQFPCVRVIIVNSYGFLP